MRIEPTEKIIRTYTEHPLNAATILNRIRQNRGHIEGITEFDLAVDDVTSITDQNHVGGIASVMDIARAVGLNEDKQVLDVGTGLGGAPRVFAATYGCQCHGVELTDSRFHDAVELTRLVGLENLVSFTHGDFLKTDFPENYYDLVTGQSTFMHFPNQLELLHKCCKLLKTDGWLAIEDGYLRRQPINSEEQRQLSSLLDCWNGQFYTLSDWYETINNVGLRTISTEDSSHVARSEFQRHSRSAQFLGIAVTPEESQGWLLGDQLLESGLIGMMRLLCRA